MTGGDTISLDDVFVFKLRFRRREDDKGLNPVREVYYRRVSIDGSWRIRKFDKPILHGKERMIRPRPRIDAPRQIECAPALGAERRK